MDVSRPEAGSWDYRNVNGLPSIAISMIKIVELNYRKFLEIRSRNRSGTTFFFLCVFMILSFN